MRSVRPVTVGFATAFVISGCSLLNPGGDVRQAAEARARTIWAADDSLTLEEDTTHNRRVVAAESAREEGLTMTYYPDGTPKSIEGASHHLSQCSEPKDVMAAYIDLASKNLQFGQDVIGLIGSMLPYFARTPNQPTGTPSVNYRDEMIRSIAEWLRDPSRPFPFTQPSN